MDITTFSALAESNRFRIVELLLEGPMTVGDIANRLGLRQPQASKHLRVLLEAGLVEVQAVANRRNYKLRLEPFRELDAWLETYRGVWDERLDALENYLQRLRTNENKKTTFQEEHSMSNKMITRVEGQEFVLERVFDAPPELVFRAFTEAEHLKHWWGPRGWTLTVCNLDFRPGGVWHYCMKCIDKNQGDFYGFEAWGKAVYEEIVKSEKITYVDYFSDADCNEAEGMPSTHVTMAFVPHEGKTKLVSRSKYDSVESLQKVIDMGMEQGITETWDRLAEHLQSIQ